MTKLCARGKSAAKRKFKVYPSAYANAYASKICAGKIKDPSGTKRKDFRGPKPAGKVVGGVIGKGVIKSANKLRKEGLPFKKLSATGILGATPVGMALKKYQDKQKNKKRDKAKVQKKMMGGVARTAGAQSALGRLEKSGLMKANKGKIMSRREQLIKKQNPISEYDKKGKLKYTAANKGTIMDKFFKDRVASEKRDIRKTEQVTGKQENKFKDMRPKKTLGRSGAGERAVKKGILRRDNSYSSGGLARGGGAAIRGTKFEGIF